MAKAFRERPEFLMGRSGELLVAEWLQRCGWYVIPSYDYSGEDGNKAPRLEGLLDRFPVPDLDVCSGPRARFGAGTRRWVEVKTKTAATWTLKTRQYEHGIEHYDDYVRVAELTGTEAWLAVYEIETVDDGTPPTGDPRQARHGFAGQLLLASFAELGPPRRTGMLGWSNVKPMAYWPREAFRKAAILLPEPQVV